MNIKLLLLLLPIVLGGCQEQKVQPKTDNEKTFYAMGTMFGQRMKGIEASEMELGMVVQGIRDAARGEKLQADPKDQRANIQKLFQERVKKMAAKLKEKGIVSLETFVKEGATKTDSGMAYKILEEGTGKKPKPTDRVKVHYHGTLLDGTVFDSSVDRGQPVTFPLNRVIRCWTEGVGMVKVGGKAKLMCPSGLAYGDGGAPPKIPGGATLIFEVSLLEILPPPPSSKSAKKKKKSKKKK